MLIEVHFGGQFKSIQTRKEYVGGKVHFIKRIDTDILSWIELRHTLKELAIVKDYIVYQKLPDKDLDDGLVVIDCDSAILSMLSYLDDKMNVVLYIEHLQSGTGFGEQLPGKSRNDVVVEKGLNVVEEKHKEEDMDVVEEEKPKEDDKDVVVEEDNPKEDGKDVIEEENPKEDDKDAAEEENHKEDDKDVQEAGDNVVTDDDVARFEIATICEQKCKNDLFGDDNVDNDSGSDKGDDNGEVGEVAQEYGVAASSKRPRGRPAEPKRVLARADNGEFGEIAQEHNMVASRKRTGGRRLKPKNVVAGDNNGEVGENAQENNVVACLEKPSGRPSKLKNVLAIAGDDCGPEHSNETYYTNSQSLHTLIYSDEDDEVAARPKYPSFNPERDLADPKIILGMQFESPQQFREFIRQYAILNGIDLNWAKNEGSRIIVKCKGDKCPFRVYGSWNHDQSKFQVKSLIAEHNCSRVSINKQVTAPWIAKRYLSRFRNEPDLKPKELKDIVYRDLAVEVSIMVCYRAKRLALEEIEWEPFEAFNEPREQVHALCLEREEEAEDEEKPTKAIKLCTSRVGMTTRCSNCKREGHNARSCKNDRVLPSIKTSKGKVGRPPKSRVDTDTVALCITENAETVYTAAAINGRKRRKLVVSRCIQKKRGRPKLIAQSSEDVEPKLIPLSSQFADASSSELNSESFLAALG